MTDANPESRIDRVVTESGILVVVGETIPAPAEQADPVERERQEAARRRQMEERERFLKRYQTAIMAFLGAMLRDSDAVTEVWGEFVEKWLEGKLSGFDPNKGSFRKFLKTVLRNDVYAYWRRNGKERAEGPGRLDSSYDPVDDLEMTASEAFDQKLQSSIIERVVESIRQEDSLYHETLTQLMQAVADDMKAPSSKQLAAHLSQVSGTTISKDHARKIKERAKEMFAKQIIEQVGLLIGTDSLSEIEQTLIDLGMIQYCQKMLEKMRTI